MRRLIICGCVLTLLGVWACRPGRTRIDIRDGRWHLDGQVTYAGAPAEGLLLNVRLVNATFEDAHRPELEPAAITDRLLAALPAYAQAGVGAITLNLQGGHPGYEGALNSAFRPDGSLQLPYLMRVRQVIDACEAAGMAVILGCFYQRQDQVLRNEAALRRAVAETARWLRRQGYRHVMLEIANEFHHPGYDHGLLQDPAGVAALIEVAHDAYPGLLVSASGLGDGRLPDTVAQVADFLLIHFNETPVDSIPARVAALHKWGKPIICNEDAKIGAAGVAALQTAVAHGCSWGFMHMTHNQHAPFYFDGPADDPEVYEAFTRLASP